jgi:hypothetical protein
MADFSAEVGPMCLLENVLISLRLIYGHKYTMKRGINESTKTAILL